MLAPAYACLHLPFAYGIRCRGGRAAEGADANWQTPGKSKAEFGERDPGESGTNEGQHQTGRLGGSPALIRPCGPCLGLARNKGDSPSRPPRAATALIGPGKLDAFSRTADARHKTPLFLQGRNARQRGMQPLRTRWYCKSVPFDSIRTASWWTRRAAPPAPIQRVLRVGVGGRQATRGSQLRYQRENPPSPLFPSPLSYSTCQRVRLHGYTATRDILILHVCSDGSFPHTASPVRILRLRAVCRWLALAAEEGEHRATAVKALGGRH
jgi:hypothetical protein